MHYALSLASTTSYLERNGIAYDIFLLGNESLIGRARNQCAWRCLTGDWSQLLFIDADLSWTLEHLDLILASDKKIIGGTYPQKSLSGRLNFNPLIEHKDHFGEGRKLAELIKYAAEYGHNGEVEVRHVPTGFLKIDREILERCVSDGYASPYVGVDARTGQSVRMWDFFPSGVLGTSEEYLSEDWAFCAYAKQFLGESIWLQSRIVLPHTGTHTFEAK